MTTHARGRPRRATPADLDSLLALERATFATDRISRRQWRRYLASTSTSVLVIGPTGDIHAATVVFYRRNSRSARLYSLAVRDTDRATGLGNMLLAAAEVRAHTHGCTAMRLEVHTDNPWAIKLYERRGFRRLARLRGFYENGADAWRYVKTVTTVTG